MVEKLYSMRDISQKITIAREEILSTKPVEPTQDHGDPRIWGKVDLAKKKAKNESGPYWESGGVRIGGDIAYGPEYVAAILDALRDTATRTSKGRKEYSRLGITPAVLARAEQELLSSSED